MELGAVLRASDPLARMRDERLSEAADADTDVPVDRTEHIRTGEAEAVPGGRRRDAGRQADDAAEHPGTTATTPRVWRSSRKSWNG